MGTTGTPIDDQPRDVQHSRAIIERGAAAASLFVALESDVDEIEQGYEATFGPLVRPGERLPRIRTFLQLFIRLLAALRNLLVVSDREVARRRADLDAARRRRRRASRGELRSAQRAVDRCERRAEAARAARLRAVTAFDSVHKGGLQFLHGLCLLVGRRQVAARMKPRRRRAARPPAAAEEAGDDDEAEEGG